MESIINLLFVSTNFELIKYNKKKSSVEFNINGKQTNIINNRRSLLND